MIEWYLNWVTGAPMQSAAVQFGLLGTLGELLPFWIQKRRIGLPFSVPMLTGKVLAWALLGVIIKYGFTGMRGFLLALNEHELLPLIFQSGFANAFALSVLTNVFFGPQMMLFHRLEDNFLAWKLDLSGIQRAWWTLLWFWIPAHTITFLLPREFQIGLAAVWSVALGIIMGISKPK